MEIIHWEEVLSWTGVVSNQGFSKKGVQVSYGCPPFKELQGKFTYSLIILWENIPPGHPVFNVLAKSSFPVLMLNLQ